MNDQKVVTTISVDVSARPDHLMATSNDLPGLNVCATSVEQVCARVVEAIKILYRLNHGIDGEVYQATDSKIFPARPQVCERFAVAAHA